MQNNFRLKFENLPKEAIDLIQLMGSKDKIKSIQAQEALAALLAPRIGQIINQIDTTTLVYKDLPYAEDSDPTIPIELFQGVGEAFFSVWSQGAPGGLPTNEIYQPTREVRFSPYRYDSAVSYSKKFARKARLDVIAKGFERLMQEILIKTNRQGWSVVLAALANAVHNGIQHVIRTETAGVFDVNSLNKLFTRIRRLNAAWTKGTPSSEYTTLTDLVISPEIMEQVRSLAYQPVNTKGANNVTGTQYSGVVAVPDAERQKIWNNVGTQSLFNVNLIQLDELGIGYAYNTLFDTAAASTAYTTASGGSSAAFDAAASEIAIGLDLGREFAWRAIETSDANNNSTFTLNPDNQFTDRSDKLGFYGAMTLGQIVTNTRPICGLII